MKRFLVKESLALKGNPVFFFIFTLWHQKMRFLFVFKIHAQLVNRA